MKVKTTSDEIDIDLDGTIDGVIKELQRLKKDYPRGRISLENEYEYGESYASLKLRFTRPKEPIELEYDRWQDKLKRLSALRQSAAAYAGEGDAFPRQGEILRLEAELGAWGRSEWGMGSLVIYGGEVLMRDMLRGAYRRDGTWAFWHISLNGGRPAPIEVGQPVGSE